ncbi:MAG TPA: hypothetical protein VKX49_32740 [Bryobacteraceae bacterium]|nr:hypothetical protein [Bryobacteraceae bacterium]
MRLDDIRGCPILSDYSLTMQLTLDLPDELCAALAASGPDLPHAILEATMQVYAFLKAHGVPLQYGLADLEHDPQDGDAIPWPPAA